ncbi:MAG: alpha-ketoglutarate decarboxylase [Bacteroidota bacterium]
MLKKVSLIIVFALFVYSLNAQKKVIPNNPNYQYQSGNETTQQTVASQYTKPSFQPRWSFGGNVGFSFWNSGTDILIAPKAYYHISPQFMTGVGLTYNYSDFNGTFTNYKYNSFGGSVLGLYRPIPFLQLSAEFQELYTNRDYNNISDSYWNPSLYLGASFVSGHFAFGFQYDVLYDSGKSPYSSAWTPVISFYF